MDSIPSLHVFGGFGSMWRWMMWPGYQSVPGGYIHPWPHQHAAKPAKGKLEERPCTRLTRDFDSRLHGQPSISSGHLMNALPDKIIHNFSFLRWIIWKTHLEVLMMEWPTGDQMYIMATQGLRPRSCNFFHWCGAPKSEWKLHCLVVPFITLSSH